MVCYVRDFMLSLLDNSQTDIIEALHSTSRYLDDLLNIDNPYFEKMVGQKYTPELKFNKANNSTSEYPFSLCLQLRLGSIQHRIQWGAMFFYRISRWLPAWIRKWINLSKSEYTCCSN